MSNFIAEKVISLMRKNGLCPKNSNILIMGFTFKENCPDARNTKVIDIYSNLKKYTSNITVVAPWTNPDKARHEYGIDVVPDMNQLSGRKFDAVIMAVAHDKFNSLHIEDLVVQNGVVYDVKGKLDRNVVSARL